MRNAFDASLVGDAREAVMAAVNQGIDARLEAFTRSKFSDNGHRLECLIHPDEFQTLIRRLVEQEDDGRFCEEGSLADDMVLVEYGEYARD